MRVLQFENYGGPEVLHIAERETPKPGPTDVLVRVHAATVGPGDCKLRAGLLQDFYRISLPKIPGRYGSGICVAVGSRVDGSMTGEAIVFAPLHTAAIDKTDVALTKAYDMVTTIEFGDTYEFANKRFTDEDKITFPHDLARAAHTSDLVVGMVPRIFNAIRHGARRVREEIRAQNAQDRLEYADRDEAEDEHVEGAHAAMHEYLVDHHLEKQRGDQREELQEERGDRALRREVAGICELHRGTT